MKFIHPADEQRELTYQDVFILPQYSDIGSRMEVNVAPISHTPLTIPVVVANMNAVAGRRMAETVTRRGGIVVLPQDKTIEQIRLSVEYIKKCHPIIETPVILDETQTLQTALNLINKRSHGAVFVTDDQGKPVGIFTEKDAAMRDLHTPVANAMTRDLITMPDTSSPLEIYNKLIATRLNIMPLVNSAGRLVGVLTKMGALRSQFYKPALNTKGEFYTAVAVGAGSGLEDRVTKLLEAGVDLIVLDTAHGHQQRMVDAIRLVRAMLDPAASLCAGNIVTAGAAEQFISAGANILKVGVGPGAMCSTRMMTGVGRPQFSAVLETARVASQNGAEVWADGGIKYPRDVALAVAAGATAAYFGSWFAGTYESAADLQKDEQGRWYKENFGMASNRAVVGRNSELDAFANAQKEFFQEGISHSKMYLKPGEESAEDILDRITFGLRSACTYSGAKSLKEFSEKAIISSQTDAGYQEGKPVYERW
jgi:IMP dehydrogenase